MSKTIKSIKDKIAKAKDNIKVPKSVKRIAVGASIIGAGVLVGAAAKKHAKQQQENKINMEINAEINAEWERQFNDADYVVADAQTAHFYAVKKLNKEDVEKLKLNLKKLENAKDALLVVKKEAEKRLQEKRSADEAKEKLNNNLRLAMAEGDLRQIDNLLEKGAKARAHDVMVLADQDGWLRKKQFEIMKRVWNHVDYEDLSKEKYWEKMRDLLRTRVIDYGDKKWQGFYNNSLKNLEKARNDDSYAWNDPFDIYRDTAAEQAVSDILKQVKLSPVQNYYGEFKMDSQLDLVDSAIEDITRKIESGYEYEIEVKENTPVHVNSDVLKEYEGKYMRAEKADSLHAIDAVKNDSIRKVQQHEVDSLNREEARKGSDIRYFADPIFDSRIILRDSNDIIESLKKKENIRDMFIDNQSVSDKKSENKDLPLAVKAKIEAKKQNS